MRVLVLLMVVMLAACTPSLEPLYTAQDNVFDPALAGIWREVTANPEKAGSLAVTRRGTNAYRVVQTDGGGTAVFTARLVQLGRYRFVDLYPDEPAVPNGFYGGHFIRAHTFARISVQGNKLEIAMFDSDWFDTETGRASRVEGRVVGDRLVLLAPTARLRQLVEQHAGDGLFGEAVTWVREPVY